MSTNTIVHKPVIELVSVEQAAKELNVSQSMLRSWMRHGLIHIGIADRKEDAENWNYTIFRPHLEKFKRGEVI